VLSDNGTAIAHNGNQIVGFDIHTHGATFQYSRVLNVPGAPPGRLATALLQAATADGGAAAILFAENGPEVALLDSFGNASFPAVGAAYSDVTYAGGNQFYGFFPPDAPDSVFLFAVPEMEPADSEWPEFQSSQGKQRDSNPVVITKVDVSRGMVGNEYAVQVMGHNFGSLPHLTLTDETGNPVPEAQIKVKQVGYDPSSRTIFSAFQIAPDAPGGKVFVRVEAGRRASNLDSKAMFFVQIPTRLIRDGSYGPNKDGLGGIIILNNGNAFNIYGDIAKRNECGIYENIAYLLQDQEQHSINAAYLIFEEFSDYKSTNPKLTIPKDQFQEVALNQSRIGDIQLFAMQAPACPGPNDNESFTQRISVVARDKTRSMAYHVLNNEIVRGYSSGEPLLTITITIPVVQ